MTLSQVGKISVLDQLEDDLYEEHENAKLRSRLNSENSNELLTKSPPQRKQHFNETIRSLANERLEMEGVSRNIQPWFT